MTGFFIVVLIAAGVLIYFSKIRGRYALLEITATGDKPDSPKPFGCKCSWWAIRSHEPRKIFPAFKNLADASWSTGITAAYQDKIFVTPPIQGWFFVVSSALPHIEEEATRQYLLGLSRLFPDIQCFSTHRGSEYHSWLRISGGKIVRVFAYADSSVLVNIGEKTEEEKVFGQEFFDGESSDADDDSYWERTDLTYPDEEYVLRLAGRWSINPQELEQMNLPPSLGYVAEFRT